MFQLVWTEAAVQADPACRVSASGRGFGSVVLKRATPQSLSGGAIYHCTEGGVRRDAARTLDQVQESDVEPG